MTHIKASSIADGIVQDAIVSQSGAKSPEEYERIKILQEQDGLILCVDSLEVIQTGAQAIIKAGFDPLIWKSSRVEATSWQVPLKVKDGNGSHKVVVQNLWRVHVRCARRVPEDAVDAIEVLAKKLPSLKLSPVRYKKAKDKHVLLIGCADFHIGKQTLCSDSCLPNMEKLFDSMTCRMIERAGPSIGEILFVNLGDMVHCDNSNKMTTDGTPQDTVASFKDIYWSATVSLIKAIERCRQTAPTTLVTVAGNHDWNVSSHLSSCMKVAFKGQKWVTVDNDPSPRKYYKRGCNLIGMSHGNNEKITMYPGLMANERKHDWADTTTRIFLKGHVHHKRSERHMDMLESDGCTVYTLPSPSGIDRWHNVSGYTTSKRCVQSFVFSEKWGIASILEASVEELLH